MWTRERPKYLGWYWYREQEPFYEDVGPYLVHVEFDDSKGKTVGWRPHSAESSTLDSQWFSGGEWWSERIEPPR